jgi:hypothetical protein
VHRLVHLFIGTKFPSSHRLFEWSKHVVITWGEVWWVWRMWKSIKVKVSDGCNCCTGRMRSRIVILQMTTVVRRPRRFDLIAGRRWFVNISEYDALVMVFPLGV